jgi:chorismate mutase
MMMMIVYTRVYSFSFIQKMNMEKTRCKIDFVDNRMCDLLSIRLKLCKNMKKYKKNYHIEDKFRETNIKNRLKNKYPYINEQLIDNIWEDIFFESKRLQNLYEE